jgi:hypothetical protein
MKNNLSFLPGFLFYGMGVAVGLFLTLVAVWADMEASVYDFPRQANAGLGGLYCPVLMTQDETGTISLSVSNTTDSQISPLVKTQISTRLLPEQFLEGVQLTPGQSKRLEWPVDAGNIDMENFIFAKVLLFSAYPLPSREATCGIFVLDLPGNGRMLVPMLVMVSLVSMGWSLYRINQFRTSNDLLSKYMGSMIFLSILIGLGLVLSFRGGWILSLLVFVVSLLLILILLGSLLGGKSK